MKPIDIIIELIKGYGKQKIPKNHVQSEHYLNCLFSAFDQKLENHFLQVESLLSLYKLLPNLKFLPPTRGWAGSPDFLAKIAELIIKHKPSLVLELSSGVSTLIIGLEAV